MAQDLTAPTLPQAPDGVLRLDLLEGVPVTMRVPSYLYPVLEDSIRGFIGDVQGSFLVGRTNYAASFFDIKIPSDALVPGDWQVGYDVTSPADNVTASVLAQVTVLSGPVLNLPAPNYPDAVRGTIALDRIQADQFLRVRVAYAGMAEGDAVTVRWAGVDADGSDVPGSHTTVSVTVDNDAARQGWADLAVPAQYVQALAMSGRGTASYTVRFTDGRFGVSGPASVLLVQEQEQPLVMRGTRWAPPWLDEVPGLTPVNWVSVLGAPGQVLKVEAETGSRVGESVVHDPFDGLLRLDLKGRGRFWVALTDVSLHPDYKVHLVLTDQDDDAQIAEMDAEFKSYTVLRQGAVALWYGVTSGADAGGDMPCTMYVQALKESAALAIGLKVDGRALFGGMSNTHQANVAAGGHLVVDLLDKLAETVTVQASVSAAGGASAEFSTEVAFLPLLGAPGAQRKV